MRWRMVDVGRSLENPFISWHIASSQVLDVNHTFRISFVTNPLAQHIACRWHRQQVMLNYVQLKSNAHQDVEMGDTICCLLSTILWNIDGCPGLLLHWLPGGPIHIVAVINKLRPTTGRILYGPQLHRGLNYLCSN